MGGVRALGGGEGRAGRSLAAHEGLVELKLAIVELERVVKDVGALVEGGDVEADLAECALRGDVDLLSVVFARAHRAHLEGTDGLLLLGLVGLLVGPLGGGELVVNAVAACGEHGGIEQFDEVGERGACLEAPGPGVVVIGGRNEREEVAHLDSRQRAVAVAVEQRLWRAVGGRGLGEEGVRHRWGLGWGRGGAVFRGRLRVRTHLDDDYHDRVSGLRVPCGDV